MGAALKSWLQDPKKTSKVTESNRNRGELATIGTTTVREGELADEGVLGVHDDDH